MREGSSLILGIDPGYARLGFGVIARKQGSHKIETLSFGVIETYPEEDHANRLVRIRRALLKLIRLYPPSLVAIEKLFFTKNQKTALQVAEARGVILSTVAEKRIPIQEFTPLQVKMAVTGAGRASKEEIQRMVVLLCNLKETPQPDDAADGLAIALTSLHHLPYQNMVKNKP